MAGRAVHRRAGHKVRHPAQPKSASLSPATTCFMGDYLRSELLDRVSARRRRSSPAPRSWTGCAGRCATRSWTGRDRGASSSELERRNLLVVPLDRRREWYRYHHLLRELLQSELRRREPDLVQDLHFRAAAWYEANAMPEAAIEHAQAAGDYDRVARLVLELAQPVWASGRVETVLRWMEWLRDVTAAEHYRRDRRARLADLRPPRPAERGRALGGGGGTCVRRGDPARRKHDGGHAGLPARDLVPRWRRPDAARCADRPGTG